jgi:hypothetical protein
MENIKNKLALADWDQTTDELHQKGYARIAGIVPAFICDELIQSYDNPALYRKVINMERYRFGMGEYRYFTYPLPTVVQTLRTELYKHVAPVGNHWMNVLGIEKKFPNDHAVLLDQCHDNKQVNPTPLILKYGKGGHNTLHQDLYGEIFFPIQAVLFLNDPDTDYSGGEFVLTQQVPRAQSRAIVLRPGKGDILLFTTNFKPMKGSKGYYRVNMKHGVSEVHEGIRHTLGIIFHDALS